AQRRSCSGSRGVCARPRAAVDDAGETIFAAQAGELQIVRFHHRGDGGDEDVSVSSVPSVVNSLRADDAVPFRARWPLRFAISFRGTIAISTRPLFAPPPTTTSTTSSAAARCS